MHPLPSLGRHPQSARWQSVCIYRSREESRPLTDSGVLRIYRVTSSNVSFLNSGNLLHTIFPKSQCWCVHGESIFVLRIRQDSYYRIELPCESDQDRAKLGEFTAVLAQVLQYERTRCPFTRSFEVSLPERPKTPPRRRPTRAPEKAKKWLFDKTWVPESVSRPSTPVVVEGSDSATTSSYEEDDRSSINTDREGTVPESPPTIIDTVPLKPKPLPSVRERAMTFQGTRSVTAPSGLAIMPLPASKTRTLEASPDNGVVEKAKEAQTPSDALSLMSSADSFYSLATTAQRTPSPPYVDAELNPWAEEQVVGREEERGRGRHRRQHSEMTERARSLDAGYESAPQTPITATSPATPTIDVHPSSAPSTPPLVSDSEEGSPAPSLLDIATPPDAIRMRRLTGASQRRAFSPMPHPQNLLRAPVRSSQGKQFTAALVRKTCELILGPPAHLVTLMLSIAAKISDGTAFGYKVQHSAERLPCSWESSDDDWDEDDYGIPLSNIETSTLRRRDVSGEVD
jgi:hypothetical protein